jgi:hypothetical protein
MKQFAAANEILANRLGVSADAMASNTLNAGQLATALGITGSQLEFVAGMISKTTFADLFSDDVHKRAAAQDEIISLVADHMAVLAGQVGLTTSAYIGQIEAASNLAAAHNELRKAIDGARTALDDIAAQQIAVAKATDVYTEAVKKVKDVESFKVAAEAARDLSLEFAALAKSPEEAIAKQEELRVKLLALAASLGIPKAAAEELLATFGLVMPAMLAEIQNTGAGVQAQADVIKAALLNVANGNYTAALKIEGDKEVAAAILAVTGDAALFVDNGPYTATAAVVGTPEVSAQFASAQADGRSFADASYGATTSLDGSDVVVAQFAGAHAEGTSFATAGYGATTSLDGTDLIVAQFAGAHNEGNSFATQPYDANATLAGTDQVVAQFAGAQSEGNAFARSYDASASVSGTEDVVSAFAGARAAGQAFATGYHATASLSTTTTNTVRTVLLPTSGAFAEGGIAGAVRETPGTARIYSPVYPGRFFGEPETGGESYIPLAPWKRPRSVEIWKETGRQLGVFADGGISAQQRAALRDGTITTIVAPLVSQATTITISSPIRIEIASTPGMDPAAVAALTGAKVKEALAAVAADFVNIR